MNLRLFQAGNLVFGTGTLDVFGKSAQNITAYGTTAEGNGMALAVVSFEVVNLYRLVVNNANSNEISGSFNAYSSKGGATLTGILAGTREISRRLISRNAGRLGLDQRYIKALQLLMSWGHLG